MERFEYSVMTKASPEVAWSVFSDWERWAQFSDSYGRIYWSKGEPWQLGSRLSIAVRKPVEVTLDHVIVRCIPGERVGWIDHALGTTMEQWVEWNPLIGGQTQIRTWAELTGWMPMIAGRTVKDVLFDFTRSWYDRYAAACDRAALTKSESGHVKAHVDRMAESVRGQ